MNNRGPSGSRLDRRALLMGGLAAGVGTTALAAGGLFATSDEPVGVTLAAGETDPAALLGWVNVKAAPYNAKGDNAADDTAAIAAAYTAAQQQNRPLYFPPGMFRVRTLPQFANYATVFGAGADLTTIVHTSSGTLLTLKDRQRVALKNMGIFSQDPSSLAVLLDHCFRCSFDSVVFRGNHTPQSYPRFLGQKGVSLINNTGGTSFVNCDFNNYGTAMSTTAIQSYIANCKFTTNWIGLLGTGNNFASGMSIVNTEFVSDINANTTTSHIIVDGRANDWWLTNVWFEGAASALVIGKAGTGGPSQFGMVNCKVAARGICLDLQHCRQPYLSNVAFDADQQSTPQLIRINGQYVPEGTAINLITSQGADFPGNTFPGGWTVLGRGRLTSAGGGPIVKSPDGKSWRLSISNTGVISGQNLGVL
ncbi:MULTISPECIES: glycosyl hydrolase family 28-related protein [unclassified Rhodococcus (in: high G+C Gram-positive bacteria)]|uniref:glycosyl hydrolase family 28-related protein n=1 Tax=unclassified Rhodococcus (in: high G+C Gram-positive bacteria) TaxID=192944 RepID=UPI00138F710A|nr:MULTISPECIES: glycosyl hydrolase family 28-related protein [unclassified Rhodococcus (in: high G+C Gram-positive bacteria)]